MLNFNADFQLATPVGHQVPWKKERSTATVRRRRGASIAEIRDLFRQDAGLPEKGAEADLLDRLCDLEILPPVKEEALARQWLNKGDEASRDAFLKSMTGRLVRMCLRERNVGINYLDILNEAVVSMMGMFNNLEEFDRKVFRTGALLSVLSARSNFIARMTRQLAGPLTYGPRRAMASIMRHDFDEVLAGHIDAKEIATGGQHVPGRLEAVRRMVDFFVAEDCDAGELTSPSHEEAALHRVDARVLPGALEEALDERAADIMRHRWLSSDPLDADELGRRWNITPERVRQIERQSLRDLRSYLEGEKTDKMIREEREALKISRRREAALARRTSQHGRVGGVDLTLVRPRMVKVLTEQELEVLSWRYFSGKVVMSSCEVARCMGLRDGRSIAQIERSALRKLHEDAYGE